MMVTELVVRARKVIKSWQEQEFFVNVGMVHWDESWFTSGYNWCNTVNLRTRKVRMERAAVRSARGEGWDVMD
jgi:hypothetical protein